MRSRLIVGLASTFCLVSAAAFTQTVSPPHHKGDPDVYKLIHEDANFRVIEVLRKKGVRDKPHGHPAPSIIYFLSDCETTQHTPDGKNTVSKATAGTARTVPIVDSHEGENTGPTDCRQLFVEKK